MPYSKCIVHVVYIIKVKIKLTQSIIDVKCIILTGALLSQ